MEKLNRSIIYGAVGACGGAATLVSAAGPCPAGECSVCLRCAGIGLTLVGVALFKRVKGKTGEKDRMRD
jgi:hypothetical protein